jgi:hypothetical protein
LSAHAFSRHCDLLLSSTYIMEADMFFADNVKVEYLNLFFYFLPFLRYKEEKEQHLRLSHANAHKLVKDLTRVQKIAKKMQYILDGEGPPPYSADEIDGIPPLHYLYGYTVAIQDFSLVRILIGKRNNKIELEVREYFIHHSDPCKIRPSSVKLKFDVNENFFYLENFIRDVCIDNGLMID